MEEQTTLVLLENLNTQTPEHRRAAFSAVIDHFYDYLARNAYNILGRQVKKGLFSIQTLNYFEIDHTTLVAEAYASLEKYLTSHPVFKIENKNHLLSLFIMHIFFAIKTLKIKARDRHRAGQVVDTDLVSILGDLEAEQDNLDRFISCIDSLSREPYVNGNALTPAILYLRRTLLGEKFTEIADAYNLPYNNIRGWYSDVVTGLREQFLKHGIAAPSATRPVIQAINMETLELLQENGLDFRVGDFVQLFNDSPIDDDFALTNHIQDIIDHNKQTPCNTLDCQIVLNDNKDDDNSSVRQLKIPHTLLETLLDGITFSTEKFI